MTVAADVVDGSAAGDDGSAAGLPVPDVEALKASARDIVEKAGQNGDSADHDSGDIVNGAAASENGDEAAVSETDGGETAVPAAESENGESSDANGDNEESKDITEVASSDKEDKKDEEEVEEVNEESNEMHTDTDKETHAVNGTSDHDSEVMEVDDEDITEVNSDTNGEAEPQEANQGDESKTDDSKNEDDSSKDSKLKTPKKKKKVEEVSLDDSPPLRRSSRKKTPTKYAELEKDIEMVEEVQEVEEIREVDSDIEEIEPEDPLGGTSATISITKSTKSNSGGGGSKKPNVVTIDDLKTLQRLATSAKKSVDDQKKGNITIIDTQAILAGKMGSGVSITPARPKASLNISSAGLTLGSGVTIKPSTANRSVNNGSVTITSTSSSHVASPVAASPKAEEYDPNLTDDTFVVEAPSFIVPYVYEKPPKETIKVFKSTIDKIQKEAEDKEKEKAEQEKKEKVEAQKKRREERQKKRDDGEEDVEPDTEDEEEKKEEESSAKTEDKDEDKTKTEDKDKDEVKKEDDPEKKEEEKKVEEKKPDDKPKTATNAYFDSTLGKFFKELGMNLVQEFVQKDLLHQQKRRAQKDKSAAVMHAIMSLQKNLDDSKEQNEEFHHEIRKCRFCSFRTESRIVMQHHMETPHMKNFIYRCNFCEYETKIPQEVLFHMDSVHGVKGKLERAPYFHQCPQCPFEDNGKGKLTRHKMGCDKRFRQELNQIPERDWDPPAKIKPQPMRTGYGSPGTGGYMQRGGVTPIRPGQSLLPGRNFSQSPRMQMQNMNNRSNLANRGRPVGTYKGAADLRIPQPMSQQNKTRGMSPQMQMLAALNAQGLSVYGAQGKNSPGSKAGSPSISITALPGRGASPSATKKGASPSPTVKPGQPGAGQGKGNFVICEICDGYIKDLEQLRNHMQWIHKVKIHPKMIYNRPPLNCQKCQFRFFTDQGLERHLLGSHGLVTASMQDAANKGQDSGRCPVCGKVYQWKLLNHVAKDHNKTLKPAHLSYKCTVCTATFGQYKLFENHVYTAHSGVAKKADKAKQAAKQNSVLKPGVKPGTQPNLLKKTDKKVENEVIDLEDEDEIDDDEKAEVIDLETPKKSDKAKSDTPAEKSEDKSAKRTLEDKAESEPAKKAKTDDAENEKAEEKVEEETKE